MALAVVSKRRGAVAAGDAFDRCVGAVLSLSVASARAATDGSCGRRSTSCGVRLVRGAALDWRR